MRNARACTAISVYFGMFSDLEERRQDPGRVCLSGREPSTTGEQNGHKATSYDGHTDSNLLHGEFPLASRPPPQPLRATGRIHSAEEPFACVKSETWPEALPSVSQVEIA